MGILPMRFVWHGRLARVFGNLSGGRGGAGVACSFFGHCLRQRLTAHPEIADKLFALQKARGVGRTFRIAKELNLSPEQSEKMAEIMGRGTTVTTYEVPGYGKVTFNAMRGEASRRPQSDRDEMRALLGDADYEKFLRLMRLNYPGTSLSEELSIRLFLTDAPLTSQQAWGIDEISYNMQENPPESTDPDARWKILQERAKSILSPGQMRAFADVGEEYVYLDMIGEERSRAGKKAAAPESK
jgi:hypothetical protein